MQVWKFVLKVSEVQTIQMPAGAKILSLNMQHGVPCMWALVDPNAPTEPRRIACFGTGDDVPRADGLSFIGTAMDDPYVWHYFERIGG